MEEIAYWDKQFNISEESRTQLVSMVKNMNLIPLLPRVLVLKKITNGMN
jgi:hypothetical protein